jgi:hypothetical protein
VSANLEGTKSQARFLSSRTWHRAVTCANLEFVGKNEAEITRSMKEAEAKVDALQGPDEGEGEDSEE